MTTLSKEDVARIAKESGMIQYIAPNNKLLEHFAALARADLVAENERLKREDFSQERVQNESYKLANKVLQEQLTATRTALAAAEAREGKLRGWIDQWCKFDSLNMDVIKWLDFVAEYNAFEREMIAEVYEECAKVCDGPDGGGNVFAKALRALAEKAKRE